MPRRGTSYRLLEPLNRLLRPSNCYRLFPPPLGRELQRNEPDRRPPIVSCVGVPRPGQEGGVGCVQPVSARIGTKRQKIIMSAALAGIIGPLLCGTVLLVLSVLEYDFMLGIGWRPLSDPADAWPSGLALGRYGLAQVANFVVSGLLLAFFGLGLHLGATDGRGSRLGPALLSMAGTAMALMGFET